LCSPHSPNTLSTALFGVFGVERATRAKIFAGGEGAGVPLVVFLYGGCAERAGESRRERGKGVGEKRSGAACEKEAANGV